MAGFDWRQLIDLAAPGIGALATGDAGRSAAFLHAYQGETLRQQQEKERLAREAEANSRYGADYLLRIGEHAQTFDDPVALSNFLNLADTAGVKAGFNKPGEVSSRFTVPQSKIAEKKLKELAGYIDGFQKQGYDLDQLSQSGAHVQLKDGTDIPITDALDLIQRRPTAANGQSVIAPKKADVAPSTDFDRYLAKYAKDQGKTYDQLTADDLLAAKKAYGQADDKTPKGPQDFTSRYLDNLFSVWKQGHPGQEPPADVQAQLMRQAKRDLADQNTATGNVGGLSDEGLDYAATQYRVTGVMPPMGMGKTPDRARIINKAAEQTRLLGKTPAAAIQAQFAMKVDANALKQITLLSASAEASETKATNQADIVRELSAKVPRTQWPIINSALQSGQINLLGNKDSQLLANAIQTFTSEYGKIIEGSTGSVSGSSDSSRAAASRLLNAAMNKGTVAGVLDLMEREMALTVQGYDATRKHITERMGGVMPATAPNRIYYDNNGNQVQRPQ